MGAGVGVRAVVVCTLQLLHGAVGVDDECAQPFTVPVSGDGDSDLCRAGVGALGSFGDHIPGQGIGSTLNGGDLGLGDGQAGQAGGGQDDAGGIVGQDDLLLRLGSLAGHQAVHLGQSLAEGSDDGCGLGDHIGAAVSVAGVGPDAEHGTGGVGNGLAAGEIGVIEIGSLDGTALPAAVAQDPVVVAVGVDHLVALGCDGGSVGNLIAVPAGGPVADLVGLVGLHGHIFVVLVVEAVVEGTGGHAQVEDDVGGIVQELNELGVQGRAHALEAHGRQVVGILVRADVVELAAPGSEVSGILLGQAQSEGHGLVIVQSDGALGGGVALLVAEAGEGLQDGTHVAGNVDAGDDVDALAVGIGDDVVHLGLGQVHVGTVGSLAGAVGVAVAQSRGQVVGAVGGGQAHVIQREAEALVVGQVQLHLVEAGIGSIVDDGLQLVGSEILSARIHMDDAVGIVILRGTDADGQEGHDHAQHQNQRHDTLDLVHIRYLLGIFHDKKGS